LKQARFFWKSTCSTCRDARSFLRDYLLVELDERDYAKQPLGLAELKALFAERDPRDFLNPKSPAFKAMGLKGKNLTRADALALMEKEPNLIKRPIVLAGSEIVAGFDRERLRALLS
jgi:Spx/MgsR family transcriptional regulator